MKLKANYKRGQKVTYTKEIMFKGSMEITATVVAVFDRKVMLDNGDTFWAV